MRGTVPAAIGVFLLALGPAGGPAIGQDRYNTEDYRAVGRALVCQCGGCNALVHECAMDRCPSSNPIRERSPSGSRRGTRPPR